MISIGLVGNGNLANHLAEVCCSIKVDFKFIAGRNIEKTKELATRTSTAAVLLSEQLPPVDILFLVVSDDALPNLSLKISKNVLVLHCAGAVPLEVLQKYGSRIGVFYPLQTFSKQSKINWKETPVFIEASSKENLKVLHDLAGKISDKVTVLNSQLRIWVHLAAVFASNYTAAILLEAFALCKEQNVDPQILHPLVQSTIKNAFALQNETALTGPAKRKDFKTQSMHLKMLADKPEVQKLYTMLSQYIESNN